MPNTSIPHEVLWVQMWGENYRSNPAFADYTKQYRNGRDLGNIRADVRQALHAQVKAKESSAKFPRSRQAW